MPQLSSLRHLLIGLVALSLAICGTLTSVWARHQAPAGSTAVLAATVVSSNITANTVWTKAASPYEVTSDISVVGGVTLTIEPGVVVQFGQFDSLTVLGTLIANGTEAEAILFTGTTQQAGWWDGLSISGSSVNAKAAAILSYVTIEYGGYSHANLYLQYANVPVTHSTFRQSSKDGIFASYGALVDVFDSSITNNAGYAIQFIDAAANPAFARLTIGGNGTNGTAIDGIAIGTGIMSGTHVWEALGVPYLILSEASVAPGSTLTIQPGVEVRFAQYGGLTIRGTLNAVGLPAQPIVFTGTTKQPGWWDGLSISGSSADAMADAALSYVTIEYGGLSYANLYVGYGRAAISNSMLRHSGKDGLYASYGGASSVIEASQIVDNTGYGVFNVEPAKALLAPNNWWGAPSGPRSVPPNATFDCNPGGTGSKVSGGVAFRPILSAVTAAPSPISPSDARLLSLTPRRWFAPADGSARIFVAITLTDGNGRPLPGRQVRLRSTLGSVTDGGFTDVKGQSFAFLRSSQAGDAELVATLDVRNNCENARSPSAKVTFGNQNEAGDLLTNAEAPYLNHDIGVTPEPVTRGVPTKLSATLSNPNNFPILVDATFAYAQAGIGLVFGPVGEVQNKLIPAMGEAVIEIVWTPAISGHYCVQLEYTSRSALAGTVVYAGAGRSQRNLNAGAGRSQRNLNVFGGPMGSPKEKDALNKAEKATGAISKMGADKGATFIPKLLVGKLLGWQFNSAREISKGLGGDPPRLDYDVIALPLKPTVAPVQPDGQISPARAEATNALVDALLDVFAYGRAATITLDKYGGAAEAKSFEWSSQQAAALLHYKTEVGTSLIATADKLDAFLQVVQNEGTPDVNVTVADIQAYQARLQAEGYNAQELEAARLLGLTDAEIGAELQVAIAADPAAAAGSLRDYLADVSAKYRTLGIELLTPPNFGGFSVSGGGGGLAAEADEGNVLVRVYDTVSTIEVGNPLNTPATLDLRVRRVDLPPDWVVTVTPDQPTLGPGERTTVTVTIKPGTAAVQGTQPRVAIEGYANGQLLGGIAIDVVLPHQVAFNDGRTIYVPLLHR